MRKVSAMKKKAFTINVDRRSMMNGRWLIILALSFILSHSSLLIPSNHAVAQTSMQEVFKSMPDSLMPLLTENNRLDFIDFVASNMEAKVTNTLGGQSVLTQLTDRYLHIRLSAASEVQMRLLPLSVPVDSMNQMICLVRTYGTPDSGQESSVTFYSCSWRHLPLSVSGLVAPQELLHQPATMSQERFSEVTKMLEPSFIVARLSDVADELTFSLVPTCIPEDDVTDIESVRVSKSVKWNGAEWIKCE